MGQISTYRGYSDRIHIQDLLLRAIVGINPEEREKRQDVLINLTLYADTHDAGVSDDIDDATNYRTITKRVIRMVEASSFHLVERLAAEIAALCLADPQVGAARVRVEKPGALRFARSVGVEITRTRAELEAGPHRVFVTLGSNIDPEHNLRAAARLLEDELSIGALSPIYETAPVGNTDQEDFLNAAVMVYTRLTAGELKAAVLEPIEAQLGRIRTEDKYAPRTIDLDVALFDYEVLDLGPRHIPDPDILRYAHTVVPLADLAPYYVHPETGETLAALAAEMPRTGIVRREDIEWD
ncbi:MAG: 2-amino-4-hydroxy-6-hydroxymethyldihydropteridine diphosphokinase [Anaerolineae bacterium]